MAAVAGELHACGRADEEGVEVAVLADFGDKSPAGVFRQEAVGVGGDGDAG